MRKRSEDVRLGDIIIFMGKPHLVNRLDGRNAWDWPMAASDDGWSIALEPGALHEVAG